MTAVNRIDGMTDSAAAESFALRRRRESRRQEWAEQTKLAEMLDKYLNAADTFWTSLENKPLSLLSGLFQKRRGVRSGLPDLLEPISKSSEEDNEAGELYKAEEVLSVVLPADEDATLPLYPGEEPLDEPSPRVTA